MGVFLYDVLLNMMLKQVYVMMIEFVKNIYEFSKKIYEIIFEILIKLNCGDERINIYIGISGLLIAIVIFVAELVSNNKYEVHKKLILNRTNIVGNVTFTIIVMFVIWINNIVEKDYNLIFFMFQILENICVIVSAYKIVEILKTTILLNTNEKYFNEQLDNYISNEIDLYTSNRNKILKHKDRFNDNFFEYVRKSKIFVYKDYVTGLDESYEKIYPLGYGYIEKYDYFMLDEIENECLVQIKERKELKESRIDNEENQKAQVILCKKIGERIDKRTPIAYYRGKDDKVIKKIQQTIIIDRFETDKFENITKIIDDLFKMAKDNVYYYDKNYRLYCLYETMCKNQNEDVLKIYMSKIEETYFDARKDIENYKDFIRFLIKLLLCSYNYDRYNDFSIFNSYITSLYFKKMQLENADFDKIAYEYANNIYNISYYQIKRKKYYKYYDDVMANLLSFINGLVQKNKINSIEVLFENIYIDEVYYLDKKLNENEMINFQFCIGLINILLYSYKNLSDKNIEIIKRILLNLQYKIFGLYEIWDLIINFKRYSVAKSRINDIIKGFDFCFDNKDYRNIYLSTPLEWEEILKCLMYVFDVNILDLENINEMDIDVNDRFKFERLLELFKTDHKFKKIEDIFNFSDYKVENVEKVIDEVLKIIDKKELEYMMKGKLLDSKIEKFKSILVENSKINEGIMIVLEECDKIKNENTKIKRTEGINELIPRELFFENSFGYESVAKQYGRAFIKNVNKKIINNIKNNSRFINASLNEFLENKSDICDYVLIINYRFFNKMNFEKIGDYLKVKDGKIRVVRTNDIEGAIVVNKNSLPIIKYCSFEDEVDPNIIYNRFYCEVKDCSKDEELINEILENADWLKQEGEEREQINYLRQKCVLKATVAYQIINPNEYECLFFEMKI